MKKTFNKTKTFIAAFGVTIISLFPKVFGQSLIGPKDNMYQDLYWVPPIQGLYWVPSPESKINIIIKIAQRILIWVTFIVWIINLIKIKKTDDKNKKKRKVKKTIIILSILIILIIACFITTWLLKK